VATQLQPHLPRIISQANHLFTVMKSLSADDQLFLIQALEGNLVGIMQDASHLRDLFLDQLSQIACTNLCWSTAEKF